MKPNSFIATRVSKIMVRSIVHSQTKTTNVSSVRPIVVRKLNNLIKAGWMNYNEKKLISLNISMMVIAYYIAKTFASGVKQMRCIALECGLQNGTLALFVSTQIFGTDILYALPTGAYALIMYITGFIFIFFLRRSN